MEQARVAALSLNLRASPNGPLLGVLRENDIVAITGPATGSWLPVAATIAGKAVAGFAAAAYLAREIPAPAVAMAAAGVPIPDDAAHPVTLDGNVAVGPEGSRFASAYQSGFYAKGITTLDTFIAAQGAALKQTPSVLRVLAAAAQNEGPFEAVNSYDNSFISAGFQQWTLGPGNFAGELAALLARLAAADAGAFTDCFGRYGLAAEATGATGFLTLGNATLNTEAAKAPLRTKEWAYRFWRAGHHPSLRAAQISLAAARIGVARAIMVNGHPASAWLASEHGVALLLDEHVNRPGHVQATLGGAVSQVIGNGNPGDPARWGQSEEIALIRAYADARCRTDMTDPMGRANRIAAAVLAGRLSDTRGSFTG